MTAKLPTLINPSDAYSDEVLKCIKDTLKKRSNELSRRYDPAKMSARNDQAYVTSINDEEKAWRQKFERRKKNLTHGFFADKSKPYQAVGTVYLEAGDLMLNSITEDLRSKILKVPRHYKESWKNTQSKKISSLQKKINALSQPMNQNLDASEATAGYNAIKKQIVEVNKMHKGVQAEQTLRGFLLRKEESARSGKKDDLEMKAPQKNNWKIVRTIGKIMGAVNVKPKDTSPVTGIKDIAGTRGVVARAFRKTGMKQKPRINNELPDMEDKEEVLQKWRHEVKQRYLILKLQSINALLCAIINMKSKMLKMHHPLNGKTVKDLLRSDVVLDCYGHPSPWKAQLAVTYDDSAHPETPLPPDGMGDGSKPPSAIPNNVNRKRMSSIAFGSNSPRRPRLAQLASKFANKSTTPSGIKVDTWEELMSLGEKSSKTSSGKPGTPSQQPNKYSMKLSRRRDTTTMAHNVLPETLPPWMMIAQTEKAITERKRIALLGNSSKRTAADMLNDVRSDFSKLQKKLSKDMDEELKRREREQFNLVQNKFKTMNLGPITNVALDKMRSEARHMLKNMKDSSAKPLKWYLDLKNEIRNETALRNETINSILKRVERFQFENDQTIPYAKEKLCILAMSMPAHQLLKNGMRDAITFLVDHVFGAPPEIFDSWLVARKLDVVKAATRLCR